MEVINNKALMLAVPEHLTPQITDRHRPKRGH